MSPLPQLPRLLALLPWLIAHPGVTTAEAAREFGISERQLVRDLELLFVCGLPGHGPGDLIDISWEGGVVSVVEDAGLSRPLRLSVDEALALLIALRTLADIPGLRESDALQRASAKLESAAGDAADVAAALAGRVAVEVEAEAPVVAAVQDALDRGRRLHLRYHVPARDETTERDVDPMRLHLAAGRPYLEGWCRQVEDVRLFRLDRVVDVRVLDVAADPPPQAQPRDLAAGLFVPTPDHATVQLRLGPAARWVADYYPGTVISDAPDGWLTFRLQTPDLGWVRRLLLSLGEQAAVDEPAELAAGVAAEARRALAAYEH